MIRVELVEKVMTLQHAALFGFTLAERSLVGARQACHSSRYARIYRAPATFSTQFRVLPIDLMRLRSGNSVRSASTVRRKA
jgi:hypothetical protein